MKIFAAYLSAIMLSAFALTGCVSDPNRPPIDIGVAIGTIGGEALQGLLPEFADAVAANCGFIITGADLTGLSGKYPTIRDAALAFCQAARSPKATRRSSGGQTVVLFKGARVSGYFQAR